MPKCAAQFDRCHLVAPTSRPKASQGGLGEPLLLRVLWGNDPRRFRARLQAGYVVSTFKSAVVELPPERDCEADRSYCAPLPLVILPRCRLRPRELAPLSSSNRRFAFACNTATPLVRTLLATMTISRPVSHHSLSSRPSTTSPCPTSRHLHFTLCYLCY